MSRPETYKRLKLEYNRPGFKKLLKEKLGCTCKICGEPAVEYHHLIALVDGGTNDLNNIIPLCYLHHQLIHGAKHLRRTYKAKNTGRPKAIPTEGYKDILLRYVQGEIGRKECENLLGLPKGSKVYDKWYYKEFLKDQKILAFKNVVDMIKCKKNNSGRKVGTRVTSTVTYEDGKTVKFYEC